MTRKMMLVVLFVISVFATGNYLFALEILLDMDTTPTSNGFRMLGTQQQQDITNTLGKLTLDVDSGKTVTFDYNIVWGDTDKMIRFGATLDLSTASSGWYDRAFRFTCNVDGVVHYASMNIAIYGTATQIQFGSVSLGGQTTPATTGSHTYHIDIDKTTKIGTFYFDGVQVGNSGSVVATGGSGYSFIAWGDFDVGASAHTETWDDVFFSNEIPRPPLGTLLIIH